MAMTTSVGAERLVLSIADKARHQYIDGAWVAGESGRYIEVVDPATEESVGEVPEGTASELDRAARAARAAFESWSMTSVEERLGYLNAIIEQMTARADEIVAAISAEMGSPSTEAAPVQFGLPLMTFKVAAELLPTFEFEYELNGSTIVREPIGVVGAITPWNFPLHQVALKVAPAIATGCTIVVKPSEIAPLSTVVFADILESVGLPAGVFNLVQGYGPEVGEAIASHPEIDMVSFTGSTRAGKRVSELAAQTVKRVALELGGKSANIVLADADLEAAVAGGVADCYFNGGQTCSARTRMLVPRDRLAEAEEIAKRAAESYVVGSAKEEGANLGPMVSKAQRDKVLSMISMGIEEGAKLVTGGVEPPADRDKGYYVRPTVFSEVDPSMTIAKEEIFGPVLSIIGYDDEEEAIQIANDSVYGLAGAVWSSSDEHARAVARRMRTGQVYINGAPLNFYAPFGGYKQSGNGREWGPFGFEEYLETKAVI
jgi:aldehyde dehydrogenase (NAD+)